MLVGGALKAARSQGFTSEGKLLWEMEPVIRELVGRGLRGPRETVEASVKSDSRSLA